MTAVQDMTEPALPRRRNGKPRSCEPCRLAKAACDHTLPRCGRCIRRGIDDRCTYHPAPMTKVQGPAKILRRPGSIRKGPQNTIAGVSSILSLLAQQHSPSGASEGTSNSSPQNDTEPQYLGSTSYSAVFLENRDSMGAEVPDEPQDKLEDCTLDNGRLRKASDALRAIPDQEVSEMLLDCSFEVHNSPLHEPTTRYCLQSLWDIWGDTMKNRDNDNKLRKMAADILRNTDTPIVPAKTAAEWLESHTGKHLRFEIIGTLLCLFALALVALPDRHSLFRTLDLSPRQYVYKLGRAAESCINVCTDLAVVNEFTLYLNYHATVVQSIYRGDDRKCIRTYTSLDTKILIIYPRWLPLAQTRQHLYHHHGLGAPPRKHHHQIRTIHGCRAAQTHVHSLLHSRQATRHSLRAAPTAKQALFLLLSPTRPGRRRNHAAGILPLVQALRARCSGLEHRGQSHASGRAARDHDRLAPARRDPRAIARSRSGLHEPAPGRSQGQVRRRLHRAAGAVPVYVRTRYPESTPRPTRRHHYPEARVSAQQLPPRPSAHAGRPGQEASPRRHRHRDSARHHLLLRPRRLRRRPLRVLVEIVRILRDSRLRRAGE